MKNYEKYANKIGSYNGYNFCEDFIIPHVFKSKVQCSETNCSACKMLQMIWLFEECEESEEPKTDWSKVEVDTPILVRDYEDQGWERRHFAKYEEGVIYTWTSGNTRWTSEGIMTRWKYAKLADSEEE